MSEAVGKRTGFEFDGFTLDLATRRLMARGDEIHISPKAFELLNLLLENRSRAMSKSELHLQIWPETFVTETNLAGLVAELRRALDDSADEPRYIRTVHRFGYWFIADARAVAPRPAAKAPPVRYWLVWNTRQIALVEGENILGRAPDASIWIDAQGVSRRHARITLDGHDVRIEDLGSKNGTFIRGRPVTRPTSLADGDQIRLGTVVITFRIPGPAELTETALQ